MELPGITPAQADLLYSTHPAGSDDTPKDTLPAWSVIWYLHDANS
jgi:hypothetical protein